MAYFHAATIKQEPEDTWTRQEDTPETNLYNPLENENTQFGIHITNLHSASTPAIVDPSSEMRSLSTGAPDSAGIQTAALSTESSSYLDTASITKDQSNPKKGRRKGQPIKKMKKQTPGTEEELTVVPCSDGSAANKPAQKGRNSKVSRNEVVSFVQEDCSIVSQARQYETADEIVPNLDQTSATASPKERGKIHGNSRKTRKSAGHIDSGLDSGSSRLQASSVVSHPENMDIIVRDNIQDPVYLSETDAESDNDSSASWVPDTQDVENDSYDSAEVDTKKTNDKDDIKAKFAPEMLASRIRKRKPKGGYTVKLVYKSETHI